MHQFRDKSVQQREMVSSGLLFYPVLMAADVLAYRAARGAGGRGPARAPRADARRRGALQRALRRDAGRARGTLSRRSARGCSTCRTRRARCPRRAAREQGTVYVLDEPDVVREKFKRAQTDSGREIVRAADKPGITNLIDILAVVRGVDAGGDRARVRGPRLRRPQDRGRRRGGRVAGAGARALHGAARRRGAARGDAGRGRRARRGRSPSPRRWPTCARRWASGPARRSVGPAA